MIFISYILYQAFTIDLLRLIIFLSYTLTDINAFYVHHNQSEIATTAEAEGSSSILPSCDEKACPINILTGEICSSHGNCDCFIKSCRCLPGWVGSTCQYEANMLSCENKLLRDCIRCQTNTKGTGNCENCQFFPKPVLAEKVSVRSKELLCSFTDIDLNGINSTTSCKYFFKLGNIPEAISMKHFKGGSKHQNVNRDVYITAKIIHYCSKRNISNNKSFPSLSYSSEDINTVKNPEELEKTHIIRNEENTSKKEETSNYARTAIGILVLAALPFISCIIAIVFNIRRFPCGLCNMFRRPSAIYLRNLRPYPGPFSADIFPRGRN